MKAVAFYGFWLIVAAASLFALTRISDDYTQTIASLQKFDWRVGKFDLPAAGVDSTTLDIVIKNRSDVDLSIKDLEVYLWLNDRTVGKTYGQFVQQTVPVQQTVTLPLTIIMDTASLSDANRAANGAFFWHISGSYKVHAPFADSDFVYRLVLAVDS